MPTHFEESIPEPVLEHGREVPVMEPLEPRESPEQLASAVVKEIELLEAQPGQLAEKGAAIGLSSQSTSEVLAQNGYVDKRGGLQNRLRRLSEALTLSVALGAGGGAVAATVEAPVSPIGTAMTAAEEIVSVATPHQVGVMPVAAGVQLPQDSPRELGEEIVAEPSVLAVEDNPSPSKPETVGVETRREKQAEIVEEASDVRFALFQELILAVIEKGATSPEAMKKLTALAGRSLEENKGALAERVVARNIPYYGSAKVILEAIKGSTFDGGKIEGFDRMKHFAQGVFGLAIDTSQLGALTKVLRVINQASSAADVVENTVNWGKLLQAIGKDPYDPQLYTKVIELLDKETMAQGVKNTVNKAIDRSARDMYEGNQVSVQPPVANNVGQDEPSPKTL